MQWNEREAKEKIIHVTSVKWVWLLALKLASQCLKCAQTHSYLAFSELEVHILVFVVSVNNSNNEIAFFVFFRAIILTLTLTVYLYSKS